MTDEELAINWIRSQGWNEENLPSDELLQMEQAFLAGLKAGRPKWHKRLERPKEKINADISAKKTMVRKNQER